MLGMFEATLSINSTAPRIPPHLSRVSCLWFAVCIFILYLLIPYSLLLTPYSLLLIPYLCRSLVIGPWSLMMIRDHRCSLCSLIAVFSDVSRGSRGVLGSLLEAF